MTDQDIIKQGQTLFQSAENLRKSALDLDALMESVWDVLSEESFAGGEVREANKEDDSFGNDWVTPIYTGNGEVRGKGKGSPRLGTITYVVRLCGNDAPVTQRPDWPWLDQACLFIGWHKQNDFWGPEDFEPSEAESLHHRGDGLWAYKDHDDNEDYGFFFVLPIFELKNEKNVKEYIVNPLKHLFNADDPKSVAEDALGEAPVLLPSSV